MKKKILDAVISIQKDQGWPFHAIMFCNELYIRAYLLTFKPKISLKDYHADITAGELKCCIRTIDSNYADMLSDFFRNSIDVRSKEFIMPHRTDMGTLKAIFGRRSHIPLGIFCGEVLIGYALIRLLFPITASYSIFIAKQWQGKGIGTAALAKELELIRSLGFAPYSAVSKANKRSLKMLGKLNIEFSDDLDGYFMVKDKRR